MPPKKSGQDTQGAEKSVDERIRAEFQRLREEIRGIVREEMAAQLEIVREEMAAQMERVEGKLQQLGELQEKVGSLEEAATFTGHRVDGLYDDVIPAITAYIQQIAEGLAMQTLDLDIHRRKWNLTVHGIPGEPEELESTTRQLVASLAKDKMGIDGASVADFSACHRLKQAKDAPIIVRFVDLGRRNQFLANARNLANHRPHVSIAPDIPPVLREVRKDLLESRKNLPPDVKKRSGIRYRPKWPYMELNIPNQANVVTSTPKSHIVKEILGFDPKFSLGRAMDNAASQ